MRDARASGHRSTVSPVAREVKQLTWFQRHILCMGIDTHKGQYEAYRRDHARDHTHQLILHHISGATGHPPPPTICIFSGTPQGSTMASSRVASVLLHRGHPLLQLMTMMMSMMKRKGTGMTTTRMRSDLQGH